MCVMFSQGVWFDYHLVNRICVRHVKKKGYFFFFFFGLGQNQLPKKIFLYSIKASSQKARVQPVFNLIFNFGLLNKTATDLKSQWFCFKDTGSHLYFPLFKVITCCT